MSTPNRKRNLLDLKQKCEIMKHLKALSSIFRELPIKLRTVGDILSNKETYESV
jgi:hypothetical protein